MRKNVTIGDIVLLSIGTVSAGFAGAVLMAVQAESHGLKGNGPDFVGIVFGALWGVFCLFVGRWVRMSWPEDQRFQLFPPNAQTLFCIITGVIPGYFILWGWSHSSAAKWVEAELARKAARSSAPAPLKFANIADKPGGYLSGSFEKQNVIVLDDDLVVYENRDLGSAVVARSFNGMQLVLDTPTIHEGREWMEATMADGRVGYVLGPVARGHTTTGINPPAGIRSAKSAAQ
jgi:hypothetical protein